MIVGIKGVLEAMGDGWAHLRVGGVTLQVYVPSSTVEELGMLGQEVELHTHLAMRDEEPVLHGFATPSELSLFQMLLKVSGIGPRIALALLSSLGAQALMGAIASGNEGALSQVSGVGRKSAARIVLELKERLGLLQVDGVGATDDNQVVLSALTALGYSSAEAARALASVGGEAGLTVEEKVHRALQGLAGST